MSRVLRLAGLRSSEAHDSLGRLLSRLASRGHTKLAARIFAAKGVTLKKPFVDVVGARYGARPHGLLGPPREDVKAINAWVEERTEGRVTGLLDDLPLEARLVLVSAVHYRGEWEVKFDAEATKLQSFHLDESNSTHVTMMHQREYPVWVGRHPQLPCMALKVPFKGNGSLVLFLPDGRSPSNLSSVVDSLTPSLISGLLEGGGLSKRSITLVMPRMDLVVDRDLKRPLEAMGL
nr:alpha-2-antiplasmin-like isoform X2 [Petromyzon marinus]